MPVLLQCFNKLNAGCISIVSGGIPTNTAVTTAAVVPVVGIKVLQWVHDRWRRRTIGCRLRRRRRKCRCLRWYRWETASIGCWLLHPPLIPPTTWLDCDWSDQLVAMLFILTINYGCTEELTSRWNKNNGSRILYNLTGTKFDSFSFFPSHSTIIRTRCWLKEETSFVSLWNNITDWPFNFVE